MEKPRELLGIPKSHQHHNVAGNSRREGSKKMMDWAISSQATWKQVEGSTTNAYDPDKDYEATRVRGMLLPMLNVVIVLSTNNIVKTL